MAKMTQKERLEQLTEQMNESVTQYQRDPEQELELLRYLNKFPNYSTRNTVLIHHQYDGAVGVASYKQHKNEGYQVQKGEKAIHILAPKMQKQFKDKDGNWKYLKQANGEEKKKLENGDIKTIQKLTGYVNVPIFDITQTDCPEEDYPKLYPNKPEKYKFSGSEKDFNNLNKAIEDYASKKGIKTDYHSTDGASKGYYVPSENSIVIDNKLDNIEATKVYLHELAHAEMHNSKSIAEKIQSGNDISTPVLEYQAEMTAYVVANKFGIDTEEYTQQYLANWTKKDIGNENYIQALSEVKDVSNNMIDKINSRYQEHQIQSERLFSSDNLSVNYNLSDKKLMCTDIDINKKSKYTISNVLLKDEKGNSYNEQILTSSKPNKKTLENWKNGMTGNDWLATDLKTEIAKKQPDKSFDLDRSNDYKNIDEAIEQKEISKEKSPSL